MTEPRPGLGSRIQDRAAWLVSRPWFWLASLGLVFSYPFLHSLTHPLPPPIPILHAAPSFELLDQKGEPFGSNHVRGRLWVAARVCTRCPDRDPELEKRLFQVQHRSRNVGKYFRLVAFTLDPANDTPAALQEHAKSLRASDRMWVWVSGPEAELRRALDALFVEPDGTAHPHEVALVDLAGNVRRYYDIRTEEGLETLLRDMGLVINRGF